MQRRTAKSVVDFRKPRCHHEFRESCNSTTNSSPDWQINDTQSSTPGGLARPAVLAAQLPCRHVLRRFDNVEDDVLERAGAGGRRRSLEIGQCPQEARFQVSAVIRSQVALSSANRTGGSGRQEQLQACRRRAKRSMAHAAPTPPTMLVPETVGFVSQGGESDRPVHQRNITNAARAKVLDRK